MKFRKLLLILAIIYLAAGVFSVYRAYKSVWLPDVPFHKNPFRDNNTHVIIYLIDALRADHLSCYGYGRNTSPNLDAFAKDSVLFTRAYAQASWTRSSVATLMTGRFPSSHGVFMRKDIFPGLPTIASQLKTKGYHTIGAVTNINVMTNFGFGKEYDEYIDFKSEFYWLYYSLAKKKKLTFLPAIWRTRILKNYETSDDLNWRFFSFLNGRPDKPFFAYLHSMDPHQPYMPEPPYSEMYKGKIPPIVEDPDSRALVDRVNDYDAEIAFNDASFGRLMERLKQHGIYENALIAVISDHGEEMKDHGGFLHGQSLFEELIHVPMIIKFPGNAAAGTTVDQRVRLIDLGNTILDYLDAEPIPGSQGKSLLPLVSGPDPGKTRCEPFFSEENLDLKKNAPNETLVSLTSGNYKLIHRLSPEDTFNLFNLDDDPREKNDLRAEEPVVFRGLKNDMDYFQAGLREGFHLEFIGPRAGGPDTVSGKLSLDGGGFGGIEIINKSEGDSVTMTDSGSAEFQLRLDDIHITRPDSEPELRKAKRIRFVPSGNAAKMTVEINTEQPGSGPVEFFRGDRAAGPAESAPAASVDLNDTGLIFEPGFFNKGIPESETTICRLYYIPGVKIEKAVLDKATTDKLRQLGYIK